MIVRLATENDIPALEELRIEHEREFHTDVMIPGNEFHEEFDQYVRKGLQDGTIVIWVTEIDGDIVSNVWMIKIRKVPKPQQLVSFIGYLTNVHTKIKFRNKGIGSKLMKKIKIWAIENNCELIFLWPSQKSVSFYEKVGFKQENDIVECILQKN